MAYTDDGSVRHQSALVDGVVAYQSGTMSMDEFLETFDPQWTRMAEQIMARYNMHIDHQHDAVQLVREEAWRLLTDPPPSMTTERFGGLVVYRADRKITKLIRSASMLSGTKRLAERAAALERSRTAMVLSLGYDPTDEELIESHNAHSSEPAKLSDIRHGMPRVIRVDSSSNPSATETDTFWAMLGADVSAEDPTDFINLGMVLSDTVASLEPSQAKIVTVYLQMALTDGAPPTLTALSDAIEASAHKIRAALIQFKAALIEALDLAVQS